MKLQQMKNPHPNPDWNALAFGKPGEFEVKRRSIEMLYRDCLPGFGRLVGMHFEMHFEMSFEMSFELGVEMSLPMTRMFHGLIQ